MVTEPHFQLTTKDHAILQAMLERYRGPQDAFAQLLERKVRSSAVYFRDDIPPGVVTLDTRFTYRADGHLHGPRLIVRSEGDDLPDYALSIHTIRGLALLGMAERSSCTIRLPRDILEELRVEDVLSQPEAEARRRETGHAHPHATSVGTARNVVSFLRKAAPSAPPDPFPDGDPGPRAA